MFPARCNLAASRPTMIMVPLVVTIICIIYMICKEWNKLKFGMDEMKRLSDLPNKTHLLSTNSNPVHSHLPLQGTPHSDAPQLVNILLLSSVGRSGSSFLAELLFQQSSTIYFFEPELYFNFKTYKGVTSNASRILLDQLYQCKLDKDWVEWALTRNNVFREYDIDENCQNKDTTIFKQCIEDKCSRKYRKLIKVIKMRLSWVAEMLVNPEYPLKVIYLVRDPRGSFTSLRRANMLQKDFKIWCPRILEDLELVNTFKALFPRDFFFVRYEDLCFDPWGTATKLWQFVSDSKLLPESWSTYLHKHTTLNSTKNKTFFGTVRDTRNEADAWRKEIDNKTLVKIEYHCEDILKILHYTKFGTLKNALNFSIPLIK